MTNKNLKTYVWTFPIRVFHWLLAISFVITYITSDNEYIKTIHFASGAFLGTLLIFRLIFGFIGPDYVRFKDFPIGIKKSKEFLTTYFSGTKSYIGHNPLASITMLSIFILGVLCAISGYLLFAINNKTLIININNNLLTSSHHLLAKIFLALIIIHLVGVFTDLIFKKKKANLSSIFTGYKKLEAKNAKLNTMHYILVLIWFIVPFYVFLLFLWPSV